MNIARAPGRLDVMGGFADYSGSLTLELTTAEATFVVAQQTERQSVRLVSIGHGRDHRPARDVTFPLHELREAIRSYDAAREYLHQDNAHAWTAYVAGVLAALGIEYDLELRSGLDIVVASDVPEGKGVSSSAAVEVASCRALADLFGIGIDAVQTALLCQRVENLVVGAACGVMDQMTSCCGREGRLLALLCQPAHITGHIAVPDEFAIWGIDSGLRHHVRGADYTDVRVAAFMGYTMIARMLGLPVAAVNADRVRIDDPVFHGYLANIGSTRFEREFVHRLPERLSGDAFLREYGGIADPVTRVRPGTSYRIRAATAHPVHEHERANEFRTLISAGASSGPRLGELMYEAHDSYTACGLDSDGTDLLVELVRDAGIDRGLFGARITGGGSGGTVAVLGLRPAEPTVRDIAQEYARRTGYTPYIFAGSSPGAMQFPTAQPLGPLPERLLAHMAG